MWLQLPVCACIYLISKLCSYILCTCSIHMQLAMRVDHNSCYSFPFNPNFYLCSCLQFKHCYNQLATFYNKSQLVQVIVFITFNCLYIQKYQSGKIGTICEEYFAYKKRIGSGGCGEVYEFTLNSVQLAIKEEKKVAIHMNTAQPVGS